MPRRKTRRRVSCGNAGAVESVESQKQASPSFHEPLGNLAKRRRDSHISTAPAARADGKVENQALWKAWKAKSRLPPLSTSPLEISPKGGAIPTFPQLRRRGRMEKWKTKSRFPTFPPPRMY